MRLDLFNSTQDAMLLEETIGIYKETLTYSIYYIHQLLSELWLVDLAVSMLQYNLLTSGRAF